MNSVVTVVSATDQDSTSNEVIVYSIEDGNADNTFRIDQTFGDIILINSLNRELVPQYLLEVVAVDRGEPSLNTSVNVTVTISDVNDHPPSFLQATYYGTVLETTPTGFPVFADNTSTPLIVAFQDPDEGAVVTLTAFTFGTPFSVDPSTGSVVVAGELDFEEQSRYQFPVFARDDIGLFSEPTTVVVDILPVNDHSPQFEQPLYEITVEENEQEGEVILQITAVDLDIGDVLLYEIFSDFNASDFELPEPTSGMLFNMTEFVPDEIVFPFEINSTTGALTLVEALDFEVAQEWRFEVVATDIQGLNDTTEVVVTVGNQNDNAPRFSEHVYPVPLIEDSLPSSEAPIYTDIEASDLDAETILQYFITSGAEGLFEMDRTTGNLFLVAPITTLSMYTLELFVTDGEFQDTAVAVVTVIDVNNNAPRFLQDSYAVSLLENATVGTSVVQVEAVDDDEGIFSFLTYSIESGSNLFAIDELTGRIETNNINVVFDFDSFPNEYLLTVVATDGAEPPMSSEVDVLISLSDVNDNSPLFQDDPFEASVPESTNIGNSIFRIEATDEDSGTNARISYYLATVNSSFAIDENTGIVRVASSLDFDDPSVPTLFELDVVARDGGEPRMESNGTLLITVTDSNDNEPFFSIPINRVAVPEDTEIGSVAFIVAANDIDSGTNAELRYEIVAFLPESCSSRFQLVNSIFNNTAEVILREPIDAEERGESCTFVVRATDNGLPQRSGEGTYIATVDDINEAAPVFTPESLQGSVEENAENGTVVFTLSATDGDGDSIIFRAVGGSLDLFDVSEEGVVTVASGAELDRETQGSYLLEVEAVDDGIPSAVTRATITIAIVDQNDNTPAFDRDIYIVSVRESHPLLTPPVIMVLATDDDTTPNNIVRYSLLSNQEGEIGYGIFVIEAETGSIFLRQGLDFETQRHFYTLRAEASDGMNSAQVDVNIRVLESNDITPMFTNLPSVVEVPESAVSGFLVFQAQAVDMDESVNGRLTYSLLESPASALFRIDGETGEIFVNSDNQFDFDEGVQRYSLFIGVTDNAGSETSGDYNAERSSGFGVLPFIDPTDVPRSANTTLRLEITDVNDNAPVFDQQDGYTAIIIEHDQVPLQVLTVQAFDIDRPNTVNSMVRYRLIQSFGRFDIDSITGTIITIPPLDSEDMVLYTLVVEAFDLGDPPHSSIVTVTVTVVNTEDETPVFTRNRYTGAVLENSPSGTSVLQVVAIDPDMFESGVNYTLIDTSGRFEIDEFTGEVLTTNIPIDREEVQNFSFIAQARDAQQNIGQTDIFVIVLDVNDELPFFDQTSYAFSITENTAVGDMIGQVQASDEDTGGNAITEYRLSEPNPDFEVDLLLGFIRVATPICFSDASVVTYDLEVLAVDAEDNNLNTSVPLIIEVFEENNYPPEFVQPSYVSRLDALARQNTTVISELRTTDRDICSGSPIIEIISGNENETFAINDESGEITLTRDLTEEDLTFTLLLRATDTGNFNVPDRSSNVTLIILIGQLLPVLISIDGGFTTPIISRLSTLEYQQDIWLSNGGLVDDPPTIRYSLGNLEAEMTVPIQSAEAVSVRQAVAQNAVYPDDPYVRVGVQVMGEGFEVANVEPTQIVAAVSQTISPFDVATGNCTTEPPSSTCVVAIALPDSWFIPGVAYDVNVALPTFLSVTPANFDPITIAAPPSCPSLPTPEVRVVLPARTIYPGDIFPVDISITATTNIDAFLLRCDMNGGIGFHTMIGSPPGFKIGVTRNANAFSVLGSAASNAGIISTDLTAELYLISESMDALYINCTVDYVIDNMDQPQISDMPANHIGVDTLCNSPYGRLLSARDRVVSLFPYAESNSLVNSATLNGERVSVELTPLAFFSSGQFATVEVNCTSQDPQQLQVEQDCSEVFLLGNEAQGDRYTSVNVLHPESLQSSMLAFRIWHPRDIFIDPRVNALSPVNGLYNAEESCRQVYEYTTVEVRAVMESDSEEQFVIITSLVQDRLFSSDENVFVLESEADTLRAVGRSRGVAYIFADLFAMDDVVTSANITISEEAVSVVDISFTIHSALIPRRIQPPFAIPGSPYLRTTVVRLESDLEHINVELDVLTEAVLSNGRNFKLSSENGLQLSSTSDDIIEITDDEQITVRGSGMERVLVGALIPVCPGSIRTESSEFIDIALNPIVEIAVTLENTTLSPPVDQPITGLPSQTAFSVELVHQDGRRQPVDDRLTFNTSLVPEISIADNTITLLESVPGNSISFSVGYASDRVSVPETEVVIDVVSLQQLQLSAGPFPYSPPGRGSGDLILQRYFSSDIYQQAELSVTAYLSNGSSFEVEFDLLSVEVTEPSVLAFDDGVVTGLSPGNATVVVTSGQLEEVWEFVVEDSEVVPVHISTFSISQLQERFDLNFLTAFRGEIIVPEIILEFSDGTFYPDFLTLNGPAVPGYFEIVSSNPNAFPLRNQTGVFEVVQQTIVEVNLELISTVNLTAVRNNISFFIDLLPATGDVDVEATFPLVQGGFPSNPGPATFSFFINAEGNTLSAYELSVSYDTAVLQVITAPDSDRVLLQRGSDLPETAVIASSYANPNGTFRIGGVGSIAVSTFRLHVADVQFNVLQPITLGELFKSTGSLPIHTHNRAAE